MIDQLTNNLAEIGFSEDHYIYKTIINSLSEVTITSTDISTPFSSIPSEDLSLDKIQNSIHTRQLKIVPDLYKTDRIEPLGSTQGVLISSLPASLIDIDQASLACHHILSLGFLPLEWLITCNHDLEKISHLTIFSTDPYEMAYALSQFQFPKILSCLKGNNISLELICEFDSDKITQVLLNTFYTNLLLSSCNIKLIQSPFYHPSREIIFNWLESPESLQTKISYFLGNATDELNQSLNSFLNINADAAPLFFRSPDTIQSKSVVVVGSGPSLSEYMPDIINNRDSLYIISAGSSIGSCYKAGIIPDLNIILERDLLIYNDYKSNLPIDYLKKITLVGSTAIDPRLNKLFKQTVFFQRPLSTAECWSSNVNDLAFHYPGPECVNAACEVAIRLRFKNILLLGCDFASSDRINNRCEDSLGFTERDLNIPTASTLKRNIWTTADLINCRDSLELLLMLDHESIVFRCGEGLPVNGVQQINSFDDFPIINEKNNEASCFEDQIYLTVENFTVLDLNLAIEGIQDYLNSVILDISAMTEWNKNSIPVLAKYISYQESNFSIGQIYASRILRSILFLLFRSLYVASDEQFSYIQSLSVLVCRNLSSYLKLLHCQIQYKQITGEINAVDRVNQDESLIDDLQRKNLFHSYKTFFN